MQFPRVLVMRPLHTAVTCFAMIIMSVVPVCNAQSAESAPPPVQLVKVPMKGAGVFGSALDLSSEVFMPAGSGPFPVLVYAHGRSGTQLERSTLVEVIPRQFLGFWLARGFAVVAPARPGYGKTGGADREVPGHSWDGRGNCSGVPNPERVATSASAAILTAVEWARAQPWAIDSKILVAGNSVGGLASAALAAANPLGVVAYINFAGGIAGNPDQAPGKSCAPERVRDAFAAYGKTARIPSLWLYAPNDKFWGPDSPARWHAAYVAGGGAAEFVTTPPVPNADGHELIFIGRDLWAPVVEPFLKRVGLE